MQLYAFVQTKIVLKLQTEKYRIVFGYFWKTNKPNEGEKKQKWNLQYTNDIRYDLHKQ